MTAIFITNITTGDTVVARRNNTTYFGVALRTRTDAFTANQMVELRIDASTSASYERSFFASELVSHEGKAT